jgi:shikimate dehydrogenase
MGATQIAIANRHRERAERLAADLAPTPVRVVDADAATLRRELARSGIVVNATSLGWHAGETPVPLELLEDLPAACVVVDLTYRDTDLLVAARERGRQTLDGLPMLVHQGAGALELWTGRPAPLAVMLEAAARARDARAASARTTTEDA